MKSKARQQEFGFTNHGGKRKGAGRKPKGTKAGVSHEKRVRFKPYQPLMVTMRLCEGLPSLRADREHEIVLAALAASERDDFRAAHYSVQSNHLHLIVEAAGHDALSSGMIGLTVRIARALNKLWKRKGKVFADR
jgi:putative transposase